MDLKYIGNDLLISTSGDNTSKIWNLEDKTSEDLYKLKKHISSVVFLGNKKVILFQLKRYHYLI